MTDLPPQPAESAIDRVRLDPRLRTRDDSGIAAVVLGTLAWGIAWIVLTLAGPQDSQWRAICLAGFGLGVIGCGLVVYRRIARTRRSRNRQE